jgi:hypothetical protein
MLEQCNERSGVRVLSVKRASLPAANCWFKILSFPTTYFHPAPSIPR